MDAALINMYLLYSDICEYLVTTVETASGLRSAILFEKKAQGGHGTSRSSAKMLD